MRVRRFVSSAAAGLVAAVAGLGTGHLAAALTAPAASPVLVVGATVIDATPTPVKEWAVSTFGTADKPLLIGAVAMGTLLVAAAAGVLAVRRFVLGAGLLILLAALVGIAAVRRPVAGVVDVVPSLVAGLAAFGVLAWFSRPWHQHEEATAAGPSRRSLVLGGAAVVTAAALAGVVGETVMRAGRRIANVTLPRPADPAPAIPDGLDIEGISPFVTPTEDFYRVDINLTVPVVDPDDWSLTIDGEVKNPYTLSWNDLLAMDMVERHITMTCVSNEVGGSYVGATRWQGVPLAALLDRAGVDSGVDQILSTAVDGFTISTPLAVATDGRDTMIAVAMNGEPLTVEHGFPARMITPGLYGFVGATKWVERLTLTRYAEQEAYWTRRGWATDGTIKISTRIDTPRGLAELDPGDTVIAGVAWAQHRGIEKVQVRIDDGRWVDTRLGPDAGIDYWRQWYLPWRAESGRHMIEARCLAADGTVQTGDRADPFPNGSSGLHSLVVRVA